MEQILDIGEYGDRVRLEGGRIAVYRAGARHRASCRSSADATYMGKCADDDRRLHPAPERKTAKFSRFRIAFGPGLWYNSNVFPTGEQRVHPMNTRFSCQLEKSRL